MRYAQYLHCLVAFAFFFLSTAQSLAQNDSFPNLSGVWLIDPDTKIQIDHNRSTNEFIGTFCNESDTKCPHNKNDSRAFYLKGDLSGNTFTGKMWRCTKDKHLIEDCNLDDPWSANIRGTVSENTIDGAYFTQWYTYDRKENERYINCRRKPTGDHWKNFRLERLQCRPIEIYADAFIPWSRIPGPVAGEKPPASLSDKPLDPEGLLVPDELEFHALEGDGRMNFAKGGSTRMWTSVSIDICAGGTVISQQHDTGKTIGYKYIYVRNNSIPKGESGAWARVEVAVPGKADADKCMKETIKQQNNRIIVTIDAACSIPLIRGAPAIDYHYEIMLELDNNHIDYEIAGYHDGFPAHSLQIGSNLENLIVAYHPFGTEINIDQEGQVVLPDEEGIASLWGNGRFEHRIGEQGELSLDDSVACK